MSKNASAANSLVKFRCASIFNVPAVADSYDLVSALGFIEYISENELSKLIDYLGIVLRRGGCAVIGSRNRLFNLISMNEYTKIEVNLETVTQLAVESEAIQTATSQVSLLETLSKFRFALKGPSSHPHTGIDVATRYQFTPSELIAKFAEVDLFAEQIYPINYQPLPQSLLKDQKLLKVKDQLSSLVANDYKHAFQLVPFSSSFVMSFVKR